jgi:putative copper resistance protein D
VLTAAAGGGVLVAAGAGWLLTTAAALHPLTRLALPAARFALDGCGVAAVGLALLGWLVADGRRRDVDAVLDSAARAAVVVAGVWAAAAVLLLWLQAAEVSGGPVGTLGVAAVVSYVRTFVAGGGLLVTVAAAVSYGVVAVGTRWRGWPELPTVLALLGLLPQPLAGHASSRHDHDVATVTVAAHAGAAAVWVGGLGAMVTLVAARRALLPTALPRFSTIAASAAAVLAVSGVLTAAVRLGSIAQLTGTGYGRVVLVKASALVVLGLLGWRLRRRVLPAIVDHRAAPLVLLAGIELVVMAVALGLAAALTTASP